MRILDLGPLRVESAGVPRPLGGTRMETVLSALLVHRDRSLSAERLIEMVWGPTPPPRASAALDTLIWRLRRALEPDRPARAPSTVLRTEDQGYRLHLAVEDVDSWFVATEAVRPVDDGTDPLEKVSGLLARWRGEPYDAVPDTGWLEPTRAALADHRLTLRIRRIELLLERSQPERAVAELAPELLEHPYAERLWALRIRGLHASGRTGAAVEAWQEIEALLRRDLQAAPGPELTALRRQLRDGTLTRPAAPATAPAPFRVPVRRTQLLGRADDLHAVTTLLARHRQVTLIGPVGCGKTRLSIAVAQALRADFADGVFFVDLSDLEDPSGVAERVQETLQLRADHPRTAEQIVTDQVANRSILLVLDNCEQIAPGVAAVLDLLVTAAGVHVLSTSRHRLGIDGEVVHRLRPLPVPEGSSEAELAASPAAELLARRLADRDIAGTAGLSAAERDAVFRICTATDGLPLGLELAAALSPVLQLAEIADSLTAHPISLGHSGTGDGGAEAGLRRSIDRSHRLLGDDERAVHRRLSVLPPNFTLEAAVAVGADDLVPPAFLPTALTGLTHRSLLEATGPDRPDGPSRFRQLVPVRAHAAEQLLAAGESVSCNARRDRWMAATVAAGPRHGHDGQADHFQRLDDNRRSITAALESALAAGTTEQLVFTVGRLLPYWIDRMVGPDAVRLTGAARDRLPPDSDPLVRALAIALQVAVRQTDQDADGVRDDLLQVLHLLEPQWFRHRTLTERVAVADLLVIVAAACWVGDDYDLADRVNQVTAAHGAALADPDVVFGSAMMGHLLLLGHDVAAARAGAARVMADNGSVGNHFTQFLGSVTSSVAALLEGDGPSGLRWTEQSLRLSHLLGIRNIADTLETRGNHHVNAGQPVDAVRCYAASALQNTRVGRSWPRHPGTAERLAEVRKSLSDKDFDEAWAGGERLGADNLVTGWL